jgi:hypothetical protein
VDGAVDIGRAYGVARKAAPVDAIRGFSLFTSLFAGSGVSQHQQRTYASDFLSGLLSYSEVAVDGRSNGCRIPETMLRKRTGILAAAFATVILGAVLSRIGRVMAPCRLLYFGLIAFVSLNIIMFSHNLFKFL